MADVEAFGGASTGKPENGVHVAVVLLVIGAIIILAVLIYTTLFPEAYWQSRELEQNMAKWESQHISHYRMSLLLPYSSDSHDRMPLAVEVRDGRVVSVVDAVGLIVVPETDDDFRYYYPYAFTIPGLFSRAYQTFWEKPPSIVVSYDPALGYPTSILIDPWVEPCCQWIGFVVRDLDVLPP